MFTLLLLLFTFLILTTLFCKRIVYVQIWKTDKEVVVLNYIIFTT